MDDILIDYLVNNLSEPVFTEEDYVLAEVANPAKCVRKKIYCPHCNKEFTYLGNMRKHMRLEHGDDSNLNVQKDHVCKYCSDSFSVPYLLKAHIDTVHLKIRYNCEHCNKFFTRQSNLHSHIKKHHPQQLHSCPICNMNFVKENKLHNHLTGKHSFVYKCSYCPKEYDNRIGLCSHMKIHYI